MDTEEIKENTGLWRPFVVTGVFVLASVTAAVTRVASSSMAACAALTLRGLFSSAKHNLSCLVQLPLWLSCPLPYTHSLSVLKAQPAFQLVVRHRPGL